MRRPEQHNCLFCGAMFRAGLPQSEQGGESARLAGQTGEPGLFPRTGEFSAGAVMASGSPGVLATTGRANRFDAGCGSCVTRSLPCSSS
jgi:hypothetical protein